MTVRRTLMALTVTTAMVACPGTARASTLKAAKDGARIVSEKWLDKRTLDVTVASPAIGQREKIRVLMPKGWSRTAKRTYPVVYAYHGGRDTYVSWTRSTDIEQLSAKYDAMVVMPEGGWGGSYTNWYNYGKAGTPKWETFHTAEVLQLMERNYHASTRRAAMGISSGGEGAITYAARHPGMFRYAASYSGIVHPAMKNVPEIMMATAAAFGGVGDPFRIFGVPGLNAANWKAHDPYSLASKLRGTGLYLSAGTTGFRGPLDPPLKPFDELGALLIGGTAERMVGATNTALVARLRKLHIPVTAHLYGNGWHQWAYWQRETHTAWPKIMKAIGAHRAS